MYCAATSLLLDLSLWWLDSLWWLRLDPGFSCSRVLDDWLWGLWARVLTFLFFYRSYSFKGDRWKGFGMERMQQDVGPGISSVLP
ncbi:hypothetical protein BDZ97DRAFT_1828079, partial [Flammula alnicola]